MRKKPVRKTRKRTTPSKAKAKEFKDVLSSVTGAGFTVTPLAAAGEGMSAPFPQLIEDRLKQDAHADRQVVQILQGTAFRDMRAARAAQLAYDKEMTVLVSATTLAERRVIDQLVENVQRRERAAMVEIINEWSRHYSVGVVSASERDQRHQEVYQLKQLLLRVRGEADREITDNTAVGQFETVPDVYGEDDEKGDFVPFRPSVAQKAWKPMTELALAE